MNDVGVFQGMVVFCFLAVLGSISLTFTKHNQSMLREQVVLFLVAFLIRFVTGIVLYVFDFTAVVGDNDASSWHLGVSIMDDWLQSGVTLLELPGAMMEMFHHNTNGYRFVLAGFFYLTNSPYRMVASTLNCFAGAMTLALVFRTARLLFSDRIALRTAWICCVMPSLVLWSALTVKEPIVILLETLALYCCVRLMKDSLSARHLALCAVAVVLLLPMRFYATLIVGGTLLISLLLPGLMRLRTGFAAACLALLIIPGVLGAGSMAKHEAQLQSFDVERIQDLRGRFASGSGAGSAVVTNYDMNTPTGFAMATLVGGAHLLFAPFPWQLIQGGSARMMLTAPELMVWWWLFFAGTLPGIWHCIRTRAVNILPLVIHSAGFGLLYSLLFSNVGLVYRQRAQLLPWLLLLAVVGLEARRQYTVTKKRSAMRRPTATGTAPGAVPVAAEPGNAPAY